MKCIDLSKMISAHCKKFIERALNSIRYLDIRLGQVYATLNLAQQDRQGKSAILNTYTMLRDNYQNIIFCMIRLTKPGVAQWVGIFFEEEVMFGAMAF